MGNLTLPIPGELGGMLVLDRENGQSLPTPAELRGNQSVCQKKLELLKAGEGG